MDRICDLFDPCIIDSNLKINIYDIPGLNDSASKNIYFEWVRQNIKLFDIIIFITDISRGLNNSDEIEVLNLLLASMTKSNTRMICLMNKCDDIYYDSEQNDLVFEEKEQENIYIQANNILADVAKSHGFEKDNKRLTAFIPISAENCFIYRALIRNPLCELDLIHQNRLCKNECGSNQWKKMNSDEKELMFKKIIQDLSETYDTKIRDTGYLSVKEIIQNTIITNKMEFLMNHMEGDIKDLIIPTIENVVEYINLVNKCKNKLAQIQLIGGCVSYTLFWENIKSTITNYINAIMRTNVKIIRFRDFIDFKDFDILHSTMQGHCINFSSLVEELNKIIDYPADFIREKQQQLVSKLMNIYEQFVSIEIIDQVHVSPTNLISYLQIISTYCPEQFDTYAHQFLDFACSAKCKHLISRQKELIDLIIYINDHTKRFVSEYPALMKQYCTLIINKLSYMSTKPLEQYFYYLVQLKKLIKKTNSLLGNERYGLLDVLYEIVKKYISVSLGTNSVANIYKQDIDIVKVNLLLSKSMTIDDVPLMEFERQLFALFR